MAYSQSDIKNKSEVLKEYAKKGNEIMEKMLKILVRAQRKVDDESYRNILKQLENE